MTKEKKLKRDRSPSYDRASDEKHRKKRYNDVNDEHSQRSRNRERSRERDRSRSRERDYENRKDYHDKRSRRSRSKSYDRYSRIKNTEKATSKPSLTSSSASSIVNHSNRGKPTSSQTENMSNEDKQNLREAERAAEQDSLDEEMRKRRERVKAWQDAKSKQQSSSSSTSTTTSSTNASESKNELPLISFNEIVPVLVEPSIGAVQNENNDITDEDKIEPKWSLEDDDDDSGEESNLLVTSSIIPALTSASASGTDDDYLSFPLTEKSVISQPGVAESKEDDDDEPIAAVFAKSQKTVVHTGAVALSSLQTKSKSESMQLASASSTMVANDNSETRAPAVTLTNSDNTQKSNNRRRGNSNHSNSLNQSQSSSQIHSLTVVKDKVVVADKKEEEEEDEDPLDAFMKSLYTTSADLESETPLSAPPSSSSSSSSSSFVSTSTPSLSSSSLLSFGPAVAFAASTIATLNNKSNNSNQPTTAASAVSAATNEGGKGGNNSNKFRIDPFGSNFITMEDIMNMSNSNNHDNISGSSDSQEAETESTLTAATKDTGSRAIGQKLSSSNISATSGVGGSSSQGPRKASARVTLPGWESDAPSSPEHDYADSSSSSRVPLTKASSEQTVDMSTDKEEDEDEKEERERREFIAALRQASATASAPLGVTAQAKSALKASSQSAAAQQAATVIGTGSASTKTPVPAALDSHTASQSTAAAADTLGRIFEGEGDMIDEAEVENKKKSALELLEEAKKGKELKPVDHSTIDYLPFRKNLYIIPRSISKLTENEIKEKREELQIKVRGKLCPSPVDTWEQCGLSERTLQILNKYNLENPFAIQKQAIPAIMCGRDIIAIAKTGSGKTLAFLLPMFRHIQDQPPLKGSEGPIALIMAPARELALQIGREARKFAGPLGLKVACIYGGAGVADQIAELKRGADIVVCTPGRMIDILCMQAGKLMTLRRVSFVVMDEADRMFDMGFEPQIRMILQTVRPDKQIVLFSATFPKQIEKLAKVILKTPLEIIVGERSTVNKDIAQIVEVHEEDDKFMRLLQLLGVWYEKGSVLIFVDKQERCDQLFSDLLKSGYPCLSLHGGHDQADRDHTLHEFRTQIKTILVATSAVSRGLDVPEIVVVINYNCPNHLEEYVHRVGRTGRAGRKGTAYTFISSLEEQYSPIMVKALEKAEQSIPIELSTMADEFKAKVARGEAQWSHSGFGGEGFTFDASEMNDAQKATSLQKRQYELEQGIFPDKDDKAGEYYDEDDEAAAAVDMMMIQNGSSSSSSGGMNMMMNATNSSAIASLTSSSSAMTAAAAAAVPALILPDTPAFAALPPLERAQMMARVIASRNAAIAPPPSSSLSSFNSFTATASTSSSGAVAVAVADPRLALAKARQIAMQMGSKGVLPGMADLSGTQTQFTDEIEINDYPPQARRKVTQKQSMDDITDRTGVTVISRGSYIPPTKKVDTSAGERKLYLLIEGSSEMQVKFARMEILRALEEETLKVGASVANSAGSSFGRYSVT